MKPTGNYTCTDYRQEMMLLGLRHRLEEPGLPKADRERILQEIKELECQMGMD
jgi:hypothetical protein